MSFPPRFLDEIRARIACSTVIGRRVRLVKRNREYAGLCPFHNEKSPSFTVNDDKGFFHCFGCGAHGDVIGFVMRIDALSFPEAVERLAEEAGLELPRQTPEQAAREDRAKSLAEAMEAAAAWFEQQLRSPAGRGALDYLQRQRGLDDATIARFRLGYAPEDRQALRRALRGQGFDDAMLVEASLLVVPEGGGEPFSFFRDRVMFAVGDRRGRVIAFGGRVMGDAKPKYINSRDTPLFDKGRSLYALDKAWAGVREAPGAGAPAAAAELVVAEGYMDVIALHAAGFRGAVAPLGTALTESQIELLWRMAPEPIVCLDGDEAGQRAALRAAERALPLLKPGHSLRFAALPAGEDPDSLIRGAGPAAVNAVLQRTKPLADVLWDHAIATRSLATPEQRAALEEALEGLAAKIAHKTVQWQYRRLFRDRLRAQFWSGPRRANGPGGAAWGRGGGAGGGGGSGAGRFGRGGWAEAPRLPGLRAAHVPPTVDLLSAQVILCTLINHVDLLAVHEVLAAVETLHLADRRLDRLLHDLLVIAGGEGPMHRDRLVERLAGDGHGDVLAQLDRPDLLLHAPFARIGAGFDEALGGLNAFLRGLHVRHLRRDLAEAEQRLGVDTSPQNWEVVQTLRRLIEEEEAAAEQRDLFDAVPGLPR